MTRAAVAALGELLALGDDVVDLAEAVLADRAHLDRRVDQAGGADHLLDEHAAGLLQLPFPPGVALTNTLSGRIASHSSNLSGRLSRQDGRRKPYSDEVELAVVVALVHGAQLRHRLVTFVDEQQGVVGDVFEEGRRRLAGPPAGQVARIVLDAGARSGRLDHLDVEGRALLQPLRFQQLAVLDQPVEAWLQLGLDRTDRLAQRRPGRHIVAVGVDLDGLQIGGLLAGQRVELGDRLDHVAEHHDPPGAVLVVGGEDLDSVAAPAERAALERLVVAFVLLRHQVADQLLLVDLLADGQAEGHGRVGLDRAYAVDARHRGHHDHVVALQDGPRRRVAHAVDLLVPGAVLLDIGVGPGDVGLGLVVVVVADEVLDRVVGEIALELGVELRGQGLVVRQDQSRALRRLDDLGHGEGLAGPGDPQQHLVVLALLDPRRQLGDRRGLVPGRVIVADQLESPSPLALRRPRRPVRRPQHGHRRKVVNKGARHIGNAGGRSGTRHEREGRAGEGGWLGRETHSSLPFWGGTDRGAIRVGKCR